MKTFNNLYSLIISQENLLYSWDRFKKGKRKKKDVGLFEYHLEQNLLELYRILKDKTYRHKPYSGFYISDPKVRHIHKATVRDRVVHHALFKMLNPLLEPTFISDSFSCRLGKGNHVGMKRLETMTRKVSKNYTHPCFVLKCDIKKFFDSVDHEILLHLLTKRISCPDTVWLLRDVIGSFSASESLFERCGLPIGNLTSQLFANVYMNELDQFMKHELRVTYYARYTDDFVVVADSIEYLESILPPIADFLTEHLKIEMHPDKTSIRTLQSGVDFLGYVIRPHHRLMRTKTKLRIYRKFKEKVRAYKTGEIDETKLSASMQSFLGALSHADTHKARQELKNMIVTTD
jgi:retron-type reverse transcriptase